MPESLDIKRALSEMGFLVNVCLITLQIMNHLPCTIIIHPQNICKTVNFGLDLQDFLKDNLKHVKSWQAT